MYIIFSEKELYNELNNLFKAFYPNKRLYYLYPKKTNKFVKGKKREQIDKIIKQIDRQGLYSEQIPNLLEASQADYWIIEKSQTSYKISLSIKTLKKMQITSIDNGKDSIFDLKRACYDLLEDDLKRQLPWGILLGIRPTKTITNRLEAILATNTRRLNLAKDEEVIIINYLWDKYRVAKDKAKLLYELIKNQDQGIRKRKKQGIHLYIHIPFCKDRCSYCSFPVSLAKSCDPDSKISKYSKVLIKEINLLKKEIGKNFIRTVYIGGGTPTILSESDLQALLEAIKGVIKNDLEEFTVEAGRPDTINREKLYLLKKYGVNRLCINPQTFNDTSLKAIGRGHSVEDIHEAYELAKEVGFSTINMDLILGLPGEGGDELKKSLKEVKALSPNNVTIHTLAMKRGANITRSTEQLSKKDLRQSSNFIDKMLGQLNHDITTFEPNFYQAKSKIQEMLSLTSACMQEMGLKPYYLYRQKNSLGGHENLGYALPGHECIYNFEMIEEREEVLALGLGSISKFIDCKSRIIRYETSRDIFKYKNEINEIAGQKKKLLKHE